MIYGLAREWKRCGILPGDTVLLHSSLKRLLTIARRNGQMLDVDAVLDTLIEALGPDGTLILPLFNFDFTRGVPFDIRTTPSQMGALTECGRNRVGAVRTGHPIYSFAAIGRKADQFSGVCNRSGYGADSPFGMLHRMGGKIAVLGLPDQNSMTFYHYVEESLNVDYRYFKTFTGEYAGYDGIARVRSFELFVRDISRGVETWVDPAGELLWQAGLYRGDRPDEGIGMRTINASEMFDFTADIIRSGRAEGLLYRIGDKA